MVALLVGGTDAIALHRAFAHFGAAAALLALALSLSLALSLALRSLRSTLSAATSPALGRSQRCGKNECS